MLFRLGPKECLLRKKRWERVVKAKLDKMLEQGRKASSKSPPLGLKVLFCKSRKYHDDSDSELMFLTRADVEEAST